MIDTKLADEPGRLASLRRYELLDTPPEIPFDKITQLVKTVLNVPIAIVSLIDADRQWFKSCAGLDVLETARDISFCTHTIKSRQPMVINDASLDPRFAQNPLVIGPPFIASYAGAPLLTPDGYALGSLCAIDTVPRQFESWQIDVLTSFAALVVDEFELRRLAHTDSLTGALTRRGFLVETERAISDFSRHNLPSSIISFDIDHFKHSNDTYGHATGDEVLRASTALINEQSRPGDILARLGGDEFALLLTGTDIEGATRTAERCRAALAELAFAHDPQLRITASFGVAALNPGRVTTEKWLADADQALYEAKQTGRNKCCIQPEIPAEPDDSVYVLHRTPETADAAPAPEDDLLDEDDLLEDDDLAEDFARHKHSIEPLSRSLWAKLRRLRSVNAIDSGRLAYGGLNPGIVNCRVLKLMETGISVESFAQLSPMPDYFSVEFSGIYCRTKMSRSEGYEIDLEFIFDGE